MNTRSGVKRSKARGDVQSHIHVHLRKYPYPHTDPRKLTRPRSFLRGSTVPISREIRFAALSPLMREEASMRVRVEICKVRLGAKVQSEAGE